MTQKWVPLKNNYHCCKKFYDILWQIVKFYDILWHFSPLSEILWHFMILWQMGGLHDLSGFCQVNQKDPTKFNTDRPTGWLEFETIFYFFPDDLNRTESMIEPIKPNQTQSTDWNSIVKRNRNSIEGLNSGYHKSGKMQLMRVKCITKNTTKTAQNSSLFWSLIHVEK